MRVLICDDEQSYVDEVRTRVSAFFESHSIPVEVTACTDSTAFVKQTPTFDLAFLDICMEPINGMELARRLQAENPLILLFMITSYNRYLDDAMDLHVFRFLQKPLNPTRLTAGLEKALNLLRRTTVEVHLSQKEETVRVGSDEIAFIEIVGRKTKIVTVRETILSTIPFRRWKELLPSSQFFAVHSSFLVNVRYITRYARDHVTLLGKYEVPVSFRRQTAFRQFFMDYCKK